ncbi:MAG: DMT family transporter [Bacillota bacterium]
MSQLTADLLLLLVTLAWGTTFVIVKETIAEMGPLTFIAVRFLIAGLVLLLWYVTTKMRGGGGAGRRGRTDVAAETLSAASSDGACSTVFGESSRGFSCEFLLGAVLTGFALFFSYATQTLGLVTVAAGKAAFITGLYVVIVPVAARAFLKASPDRASVAGVILATIGLGLLSLKLPLQVAPGDFLVFLCAIGFSAHILLVGHYSERGNTVLFAAIQLLVVSAGSFVYAAIMERPLVVPPTAWGAILFTAIAATSFAFLAQTAVQRFTSATHTALIFSAEPVFGAIFAWLVAGEVLAAREIVGAICILTGMLVSESGLFRRPHRQSAQ